MSYIIASNGKRVILDSEDARMFRRMGFPIWIMKRGGYPAITICGKNFTVHSLLVKRIGGMVVDHINRNPLDNRRENLRLCTHRHNTWNGRAHSDGCTGIRGVSYRKKEKAWIAYISINRKWTHLGYFKSKRKAVAVRKLAEKKFYREFAPV